jgi:hypothetical protein
MIRTARQIKVENKVLSNKNIKVKVGTVENKKSPETIYIELCFWVKPKDSDVDGNTLKKRLYKELKNIYTSDLYPLLINNSIFPKYKDNIFIVNVPESINYNNKKNFVSIELYLHTINLTSKEEKFPLNKTEDSKLFKESLNIINCIANTKILSDEGDFMIFIKK